MLSAQQEAVVKLFELGYEIRHAHGDGVLDMHKEFDGETVMVSVNREGQILLLLQNDVTISPKGKLTVYAKVLPDVHDDEEVVIWTMDNGTLVAEYHDRESKVVNHAVSINYKIELPPITL